MATKDEATLLLTTEEADLPSERLFAECLRLLLHRYGIVFTESRLRNCEWVSPTGLSPVIHHEGQLMTDFACICDHYQRSRGLQSPLPGASTGGGGQGPDGEAQGQSKVLMATFQSYISAFSSSISCLIDHLTWIPDSTYSNITKARYASGMVRPLAWLLPGQARSRVRARLDAVGWLKNQQASEEASWLFSSLGLLAKEQTTGHLLNSAQPTGLDCLACGLATFALACEHEIGFEILYELVLAQPDLLAYQKALSQSMSDEEVNLSATSNAARSSELKEDAAKKNCNNAQTNSDQDDLNDSEENRQQQQQQQNNDELATSSEDSDEAEKEENDYEEQLSMSQTETLLHYQQISGLELPQCRPGPGSGQHRPQQAPVGWFRWIESIVMLPFRFFSHSVGSLLRFVLSILRPAAVAAAPHRPVVDPVGDVRQFLEQFEQLYGEQHPVVRVCSYSQALDAARNELRFLLVYLHAESHQDTDQFCRQVLVSEVFSAFLQASGINFWMCSISSPEGARVSQALRETGYPFLALIVLKQSRMTVVARFEGLLSLEQLLAELDAAVTDFEPYLAEERARRQSLEMNRRLIEEQDQAYAAALAQDREREERRQAEEAERSAERDANERRREERQRELARLRDLLPAEPSADKDGGATVKLSVRLPGASDRLERRFRLGEPIQHLHYFIKLQELAPERFSVCTSFPKRVLPVEGTFKEAGLTQAEVLFVMDDDDE
uniref:UBX domain-containing protein n=1 Tax=Macrostomum lignano TaxID=282301 RepID=A0A1I8HII3_9PLAT